MDKLQEAAEYFRQNPVWKKIFEELQIKEHAVFQKDGQITILK